MDEDEPHGDGDGNGDDGNGDDDDGFHHRNFYLALSIPVLAFEMNENVFPLSRSLFFLFFFVSVVIQLLEFSGCFFVFCLFRVR